MRAVVVAAVTLGAGCALVTGLDDLGGGDAASDASGDVDAATDAGSETGSVYTALDAAAAWTTFDMKTLDAGALTFSGGAFDGRYVYFSPTPGAIAARYDVKAPFGTGTSWQTFAVTSVDPLASGFDGAVFDGRYVYYVPNFNGGNSGHVARFDTTLAFDTSSSWTAFDTSTLNGNLKGFIGATFDGRYVYFVPHFRGVVARYDTQGAGLSTPASWAEFDVQSVNAAGRGFSGGVFDGRYVYFVPNINPSVPAPSDLVARYDTQASFTATTAWTVFGTKSANANAAGYFGAAFDGRRTYFAPNPSSVVASYDTQAVFGAPASWTTLDMGSITQSASNFRGATFDGKYVYFVPTASTVARYDTEGAFGLTSSWSTTGIALPDGGGTGSYAGAIFDGRYVYFVPAGGLAARFDAKQPADMPKLPAWYGSFY
jgi:hypothetical protein